METNIKPGMEVQSKNTGIWYTVVPRDSNTPSNAVAIRFSSSARGFIYDQTIAAVRGQAEAEVAPVAVGWNGAVIAIAIEHERDIAFDYKRLKDSTTRLHVVRPIELEDDLLLSLEEGNYKSFRLDRILGYVSVPSQD